MSIRKLLLCTTLALAALPIAASAQVSGNALKNLLGNASDAALDKLSKPGAFSADSAIRIALPGGADKLAGLMKLGDRAGLTSDLSGSLNHAAEQAAGEAKPIFRNAIDRASMDDAVGVAKGGDTGATDYLRKSSGSAITAKLRPLVEAALAQAGLLQGNATLSSIGMTPDRLTEYVTGKTSDGIFTYVGREETRLRQNPVDAGKEILKGLKF